MYASAVYLLEIFNFFFSFTLVQYGSLAQMSILNTESFALFTSAGLDGRVKR